MDREEMLQLLAEPILAVARNHRVRVGIDGITAAGKTTLADELAGVLADQPRKLIRVSLDDFHNPPEVRYRLGRYSPEGYYRDAMDIASIRDLLLLPLGPGGNRSYRAGNYSQPDSSDLEFEAHTAPNDAIALIDGIFLFRPELNDCWDYRVFIEVQQSLAVERGIKRDLVWIKDEAEARRRYEERYVPGERLYLDAVRPWELVDAIVTNDNPTMPGLRFRI